MKNLNYIFVFLLLFSAKCEDDDRPANPIDQLPPLTMTGENTFGCLIDGRVFKPQGGGLGGPSRGASFQYISNNGDSYYQFLLFGSNDTNNENIGITLKLINFEELTEVKTYLLSTFDNGGLGEYIIPEGDFGTNLTNSGILSTIYYDYENRIISGTFKFEVEVDGKIIKITDGRFDMKFTI